MIILPRLPLLFLVFFSLSANAQSADERKLIPRADLFAEPACADVRLGSEGQYVWFRRPAAPDTLFYVSTRNGRFAHAVALPGELVRYRTVRAGGVVVVVRAEEGVQIHYWRSGRLADVTPFPPSDARVLATSPRFPNKVVMRLSAKNEAQSGVWLVDLWGSRPRRIGRYDDFEKLWFDQMFNLVAAEKSDGQGGRLLLSYGHGKADTIGYYPFEPGMFVGGLQHILSVSTDGQTIWFTDNEGRDKTVLMRYDRTNGTFEKLAQDDKADILPWGATIAADGHVQAVVALWADTRRHIIDPGVSEDFRLLDSLLNGQTSWVASTADDSLWLVRSLDGTPTRYYTWDRRRKRLYELFATMPWIERRHLGKRRAWTVRTADSLELPVHVYLPPWADLNDDGVPREPLPTVFYVHGGPWAGLVHWNDWRYVRNFQLLANRGYAVVVCEFRGTTGLGRTLTEKGKRQWGRAMHDDLMNIVDWAVNQRIAHPDKLAMWGWSYGAYATAWALAREPDRFRCGIAMYGPADLEAFSRIPFTDSDFWREWVGNPDTDEGAAALREVSPINYVDRIEAPLFLTTGGKDARVPREQVDAFARALAEAGKEVVYVVYPDEGHDYREAGSWISFWALAEQFLAKNLGGRYQPAGDDPSKGKYEVIYGQDFISRIDW